MHIHTRHTSDELIDRELQALREPASSVHGLGDAILAMQATPTIKGSTSRKWLLRLGPAVGIGAVALAFSLSSGKAYAGELQAIANAQNFRQAKYQKSFLFGGQAKPYLVTELFIQGDSETFRQFAPDGTLQVALVRNGDVSSNYFSGDALNGLPARGSIDEDHSGHMGIDSIDSLLHSSFFRTHSVVKKTGVELNGHSYDYYDLANGYYRLWVDPDTKLIAQREIYDHGKTLWERDVYDYPASFPKPTFKQPQVPGITFFDYLTARRELERRLADGGDVQNVGGVSICLKALIRDHRTYSALFTTTGAQGDINDNRNCQVSGATYLSTRLDLSTLNLRQGEQLLTTRAYVEGTEGTSDNPTVKIGAWNRDGKFVGWATFRPGKVLYAPFAEQLVHRSSSAGGVAKASPAKGR
ncbi:MAG: hypothetical protein GC165_07215 [Armatimonadetes bacterium]|nr:hypothetical protein [Armatimonadota bacterium]